MMPRVASFSVSENPFQVTITGCADPACDCTQLFFTLQEVTESDRSVPAGLTLKIRVDGDTWREVAAPPRDRLAAQIVQELLDNYPASGKEYLQHQVREKRRVAHRLRDYRFPPHVFEDGSLILFREIISDDIPGKIDLSAYVYQWEHDGEFYVLDDHYCPNPTCTCREVHVSFLHCGDVGTGRPLTIRERFVAVVSLDGKWRIKGCYTCTESEAKSLLRAWRKDEPDHLEKFRWRYQKVKEIAQRSPRPGIRLSEEDALALRPPRDPSAQLPFDLSDDEPGDELSQQPVAGTIRVGRNEPCPCGSGKKYKKCCGKGGPPQE